MQEQAWPSTETGSTLDLGPVHDPALRPLSILLIEDDIVLSCLDVLFKHIEHADQDLSVAGLSTVVTPNAYRGNGYGRTLVTTARESMRQSDVDLGLFTCDRELGTFYESCGWQKLVGTVLVGGTPNEPFPSDQPGFDKVTLGAFFTPAAIQARASVLGARIMLHSGVIDKLW